MTEPIPCFDFIPDPAPEPDPDPAKARRWFHAATWNVWYGTPVAKLEPTLTEMIRSKVSIILSQEAGGADITSMYERHGWETFVVDGEYRVSWNPEVWEAIERADEQLTSTPYFRAGKKKPIIMRAARVLLRHRKSGHTVDALSYHLPSAVQRGGPNRAVPRRLAALRDSMQTLARIARESPADAVLFGGDDNVDERVGKGWGFMLAKATGLRQIVAPRGTHGKRKIDDFRVKRLMPGNARVLSTAGDHLAHLRWFRFPP